MIEAVNRARAVLTAFLLASALGLAGCTDDDPEPRFAPPSSAPPASPSTSAASGREGPKESFASWVEARNDALRSGDTSLVRAFSSPACKACQDAIEPIDQVHAEGGRFETDGWTVVSSRVKSEAESRVQLSAAIRYESGQTVPSEGADPIAYEAERHIVLVDLVSTSNRWLVRDLVYLS